MKPVSTGSRAWTLGQEARDQRSRVIGATLMGTSTAMGALFILEVTTAPPGGASPILTGVAAALTVLSVFLVRRGMDVPALSAVLIVFTLLSIVAPILIYESAISSVNPQLEVFVLFAWFPGSLSALAWRVLNPIGGTVASLDELLNAGVLLGLIVAILLLVSRLTPSGSDAVRRTPIVLVLIVMCSYFLMTPQLLPVNNSTVEWLVGVSFFLSGILTFFSIIALDSAHGKVAVGLLAASLFTGHLLPTIVYGVHESFPPETWFPIWRSIEYFGFCPYMNSGACAYGLGISVASDISLIASVMALGFLLRQGSEKRT